MDHTIKVDAEDWFCRHGEASQLTVSFGSFIILEPCTTGGSRTTQVTSRFSSSAPAIGWLACRDDHETVMQLHVPVAEHRNLHPNCLHLWRPLNERIPQPPPDMVA